MDRLQHLTAESFLGRLLPSRPDQKLPFGGWQRGCELSVGRAHELVGQTSCGPTALTVERSLVLLGGKPVGGKQWREVAVALGQPFFDAACRGECPKGAAYDGTRLFFPCVRRRGPGSGPLAEDAVAVCPDTLPVGRLPRHRRPTMSRPGASRPLGQWARGWSCLPDRRRLGRMAATAPSPSCSSCARQCG